MNKDQVNEGKMERSITQPCPCPFCATGKGGARITTASEHPLNFEEQDQV